ncbi:N-acetylmuramidase family protein [Acinetobacter sp. TUM15071]|uniref:N-acetylmuramidase family protein n=1 Tax=Acinetobacter sp. TUM15071 TaxID=2609135 RepID=UPI00124E0ABA|nr:N-acetylmuramidase family protein [Acinetobacter sp. TUM15071]
MNKKITIEQIIAQAKDLNIETAALQAVIEVECKGNGFNDDGTPVILFERHIMRRRLINNKKSKIADEMMRKRPDLCSTTSGGYGLESVQHLKLKDAVKFDRISALESCSWGLGQVMGYHWYTLGYESIQEFINAMYKDEASQLEAMCRYIKFNNLINALKNKDWTAFAKVYNGKNYKVNNYDTKLANTYKRFAS